MLLATRYIRCLIFCLLELHAVYATPIRVDATSAMPEASGVTLLMLC